MLVLATRSSFPHRSQTNSSLWHWLQSWSFHSCSLPDSSSHRTISPYSSKNSSTCRSSSTVMSPSCTINSIPMLSKQHPTVPTNAGVWTQTASIIVTHSHRFLPAVSVAHPWPHSELSTVAAISSLGVSSAASPTSTSELIIIVFQRQIKPISFSSTKAQFRSLEHVKNASSFILFRYIFCLLSKSYCL